MGVEGAGAGLGEGPSWVVGVVEVPGVCLLRPTPHPCPTVTKQNSDVCTEGNFIQISLDNNQVRTKQPMDGYLTHSPL